MDTANKTLAIVVEGEDAPAAMQTCDLVAIPTDVLPRDVLVTNTGRECSGNALALTYG